MNNNIEIIDKNNNRILYITFFNCESNKKQYSKTFVFIKTVFLNVYTFFYVTILKRSKNA
ncbi:hypothetical protein AUW17_12140 [Tenacibaculum dicentrarchi]|nr:hypothetical protein AUW17_12140 [Tenacibaculum dicentrarchi]